MKQHLITGNRGETMAVNYLKEHGYEILAQNYRYKRAEIDIICQHDDLLVFVEVKTRKSLKYGQPEEAVSDSKANKVMEGAEQYIYDIDWTDDIRFDIISIVLHPEMEIVHFKDAFH